jgi:beta-lactamase class A
MYTIRLLPFNPFSRLKTRNWLFFGLILLLAACQEVNSAENPAATVDPNATPTATLPPTSTPRPLATLTPTPAPTPTTVVLPDSSLDLRYLQSEIEKTLADFFKVSSYIVVDLATGDTIARNADVAISGMSLLKIPILIETYAALDQPPDYEQNRMINQTIVQSSNFSANVLMRTIISDRDDSFHGAEIVTNSLRDMDVFNTFITVPFDQDAREGRPAALLTAANNRSDITTYPDPFRQTTAADLAVLLEWLYACAESDAGPLRNYYGDRLTQAECQELLTAMQVNELVRLFEGGLPEDATFAHKIGYVDETYGDAGIVFSPGGDYVMVMALYTPVWLQWDVGSPLFREVARLTHAHFNDEAAYSAEILANPPDLSLLPPPTPTPDLPQAMVYGTRGVGLALRDIPGGNHIGLLPDSTMVSLLPDVEMQIDNRAWRRVRTTDGKEGWVGTDFLVFE